MTLPESGAMDERPPDLRRAGTLQSENEEEGGDESPAVRQKERLSGFGGSCCRTIVKIAVAPNSQRSTNKVVNRAVSFTGTVWDETTWLDARFRRTVGGSGMRSKSAKQTTRITATTMVLTLMPAVLSLSTNLMVSGSRQNRMQINGKPGTCLANIGTIKLRPRYSIAR